MTTLIESKQNATLRHLARLAREKKYRHTTHETVCEGEKMLYEALRAGVPIKTVLLRTEVTLRETTRELIAQAEVQGAQLFTAAPALFSLASDVETPQGIVFSCVLSKDVQEELPAQLGSVMLLDGVQDPGNLGTILRTADAFGLEALILCEGCADLTAPKVVRATMGAIFRQPVYRMPLVQAISALRAQKMKVYAAALDADSVSLSEAALAGCAVIVGSEGHGVTPAALALCDQKMMIPMKGQAESLNAGVAASILIWEMTRVHGA